MLRSLLADWDAGKVSEAASTSRLLENLLPGHNYSIFVGAQTRAGRGPFSREAWVFCSTRDEGMRVRRVDDRLGTTLHGVVGCKCKGTVEWEVSNESAVPAGTK